MTCNVSINRSQKFISKKEFFQIFRKLFSYFHEDKFILILAIIVSCLEACLITASSFCIGLLYNNFILKQAEIANKWSSFVGLCLVILVTYVLSQIFFLIHKIWVAKVSEKIMFNFRAKILKKLHSLPMKNFDHFSSGQLMARTSNDIDNVSQLFSQHLASIFFYGSLLIVNILMMFLINWFLACIVLFCLVFIVLIDYFFVRRTQPYFVKQQNSLSRINGYVEEMVSGSKIISLFNQNKKTLKEFDLLNQELVNFSLYAQVLANLMNPINRFLIKFCGFILRALGFGLILFFGFKGNVGRVISQCSFLGGFQFMPMALLAVFNNFMKNYRKAFSNLIFTFSFIFSAFAGVKRVFLILDLPEEENNFSAKSLKNISGQIEAKKLCFSFNQKNELIKNSDFLIKQGQKIILIGPSDSGKTSLVNLFNKFYQPTVGSLLVDNVPINQISSQFLRKNIVIFSQESFFFNVSIRENIRYGNLLATNEDIEQITKLIGVHDFIEQMPQGYETILQDNGTDLSIGQRQLLILARVLLAKPKILILDEIYNYFNFDKKDFSQNSLVQVINKMMYGKTLIYVTHHLPITSDFDQFLVLEKNKITAFNSYNHLLKSKNYYSYLYHYQYQKN